MRFGKAVCVDFESLRFIRLISYPAGIRFGRKPRKLLIELRAKSKQNGIQIVEMLRELYRQKGGRTFSGSHRIIFRVSSRFV